MAATSARSRFEAAIALLVFSPQAVAAARKPLASVKVSIVSLIFSSYGRCRAKALGYGLRSPPARAGSWSIQAAVGLKRSATDTKPACVGWTSWLLHGAVGLKPSATATKPACAGWRNGAPAIP